MLVCLLVLAVSGCGSSTRSVRVPAPPATIVPPSETDSVRLDELPPRPVRGAPTAPRRVETFDRPGAGPVARVERVTIDRQNPEPGAGRVRILYRTPEGARLDVFRLPAPGEALDVTFDRTRPGKSAYTGAPVAAEGSDTAGSGATDSATGSATNSGDGPRTDARIRGTPQDRTVEAEVPDEPDGVFGRMAAWVRSRLAWIGGVAVVVIVLGFLFRSVLRSLLPF